MQVDGDGRDLHPARLEFRERQQRLDESTEATHALVDVGEMTGQLRIVDVGDALEAQLRECADGVQRRAHLVRRVGQELVLGAVGCLGFVTCKLECLGALGDLPGQLGRVGEVGEDAADLAVHDVGDVRDAGVALVAPDVVVVAFELDELAIERTPDVGLRERVDAFAQQLARVATDDFAIVGRVPLARRPVDELATQRRIPVSDLGRHVVQDRLQAPLALGHPTLGLAECRDVPDEAEQPALAVERERRDAGLRRVGRAVAAPEGLRERLGLPGPDPHPERHRFGRIQAVDDVHDRELHGLLARAPPARAGGGIGIEDPPVDVPHEDRIGRVVDHRTEPRLALAASAIGRAQLRDVEEGCHRAGRCAATDVEERIRVHQDPGDPALGQQHAHDALPHRFACPERDHRRMRIAGERAAVLADAAPPRVHGIPAHQLAVGQSENAGRARIRRHDPAGVVGLDHTLDHARQDAALLGFGPCQIGDEATLGPVVPDHDRDGEERRGRDARGHDLLAYRDVVRDRVLAALPGAEQSMNLDVHRLGQALAGAAAHHADRGLGVARPIDRDDAVGEFDRDVLRHDDAIEDIGRERLAGREPLQLREVIADVRPCAHVGLEERVAAREQETALPVLEVGDVVRHGHQRDGHAADPLLLLDGLAQQEDVPRDECDGPEQQHHVKPGRLPRSAQQAVVGPRGQRVHRCIRGRAVAATRLVMCRPPDSRRTTPRFAWCARGVASHGMSEARGSAGA